MFYKEYFSYTVIILKQFQTIYSEGEEEDKENRQVCAI